MEQKTNVPFSLEWHLNNLGTYDVATKELVSIYNITKKRLTDRLINSRNVFVEYSLHDASHSRTIIRAIERFLGEPRIRKLSATDTFMILVCAYAHDYGMAKSYEKIYEILGSKSFKDFINEKAKNNTGLDEDDIDAIRDLKNHMDESYSTSIPLNRLYRSIMHAVQLYLRKNHSEGVLNFKEDFETLLGEELKERFIYGSEGIVEICMCHGKEFSSLFELSRHADGIVGDDFHPRFIAAMIRLGDLLDLDNGRFPEWFLKEIKKPDSIISDTSKLHANKHHAITHLLITDKEINIKAYCESESTGEDTAMLISEWTDSLKEECKSLVLNWGKIAQPDFGLPPGNVNVTILLDKKAFSTSNRVFQMQMSQEKAMDLLKGTSIYQNQYVGIRELLQNAIDASLLQMWVDIKQNRYKSLGISKNSVKRKALTLLEFSKLRGADIIFSNYDVTIELIKNLDKKRVEVVVKDRGIGISKEDVKYIANIGSSEMNVSRKKLVEEMPDWLKPSGIFGIGIQSVFQIARCIEFYTRQHNKPERKISVYSYGRSRGRVQISDVPPNRDGLYNDNSIPGTNAKIIIDRSKFSFGSERNPESDGKPLHLMYYDEEFDRGDDLDILYAEICQACKAIVGESKRDYFNVHLQELTVLKERISGEEGETTDERRYKNFRNSYFHFSGSADKDIFGHSATLLYRSKGKEIIIDVNKAFYWDDKKNRAYRLVVRPCIIKDQGTCKRVHVPQKKPDLYKVSYKFNKISQSEAIYSHKDANQSSHAGFLMWNIHVLSYPPTDYVNIDRDRLRPDAINEEELLEIRNIILGEWCLEFVNNEKMGKALESNIEMLLSFIILFFQNIDSRLFDRFIEKYGKLVGDDLYIGNEEIKIKSIWEKDTSFYADKAVVSYLNETAEEDHSTNVSEEVHAEQTKGEEVKEPDKKNEVSEEVSTEQTKGEEVNGIDNNRFMFETVRHFPHRLVHPSKIERTDKGIVRYSFKFGSLDSTDFMLEMDEYAKAIDYTLAMQSDENNKDRKRIEKGGKIRGFSFLDIPKKVFKPDSAYKHLIVSKYPTSFQKGHNFSNFFDECIKSYILSPFGGDDLQQNSMLSNAFNSVLRKENDIKNFVNLVEKSKQFNKCVEYASRFGVHGKEDLSEKAYKEIIRKEYRTFVEDFCRILIKYQPKSKN